MLAAPGSDPSHPFGVLWELREWVLAEGGGLVPDTERGDRVAAHASDRIRERLLVDETGAEDRVRQGLSSRAHAVEVLVGQDVKFGG